MGFDIQMVETPPAAELRKAGLDAGDKGYFRFNYAAMPVMVVTMTTAGALVDEPAPKFPAWPPPNTPADRKNLLEDALGEPSALAKLTASEKATVVAAQKAFKAVRLTRSKHAGAVPAFKFASNDGFIVTAEEAAIIGNKLRAYASKVDAAQIAKLEKIYAERQKRMLDAMKAQGEQVVLGDQPLGLTVDTYRAWILEWAAYNDVASHHGGYEID